ncbi:hypothetical protein ACSMXN_09270 [Jatrophihabitans sp. DSM 45814]
MQSVPGVWDALYSALQTLFPAPAYVSAGDPGEYQPDLIIAMMGITSPTTRPTMGTNRSREEIADLTLVISAYVAGGAEAQAPAIDAAYVAYGQLVAYLRATPNEKLGGSCYDSWVSFGSMVPSTSWEHVEGLADPVPAGRIADLTCTVTAKVRY